MSSRKKLIDLIKEGKTPVKPTFMRVLPSADGKPVGRPSTARKRAARPNNT